MINKEIYIESKYLHNLLQKPIDNFFIFFISSIILHLIIGYFFLFGMPSFYEKLPEEQVITFEMLPISDKSNVITQKKQKESAIENNDAKKSEQSKPRESKEKQIQEEPKINNQDLSQENLQKLSKLENKKEIIEEKKLEKKQENLPEKKIETKKEETKKEKKLEEQKDLKNLQYEKKNLERKEKKENTDELDSLLKNLEQSSEGDNLKSNKYKRSEKINNAKESKGKYNENMPLSVDETALIKRQIERHWNNIPAGARSNSKLRIIVNITLDKLGNVEQVIVKERTCPNISPSVCTALSDSAIRAVWQASPIENLEPARFNYWKEINFSFDPSKL